MTRKAYATYYGVRSWCGSDVSRLLDKVCFARQSTAELVSILTEMVYGAYQDGVADGDQIRGVDERGACGTCEGEGQANTQRCSECDGTGRVPNTTKPPRRAAPKHFA